MGEAVNVSIVGDTVAVGLSVGDSVAVGEPVAVAVAVCVVQQPLVLGSDISEGL